MAEVLSVSPHNGSPHFPSSPTLLSPKPSGGGLKRSPSFMKKSSSSFMLSELAEEALTSSSDHEHSPSENMGSDFSRRSSSQSTAPTSIGGFEMRSRDDDDNFFPSYGNIDFSTRSHFKDIPRFGSPDSSEDGYDASQSETSDTATVESSNSPELAPIVDDTALRPEPTRQVDYLSHKWNEEEVAASWKHIVGQRRTFGEQSRLENASWRGWAKTRGHLPTVSANTINWLKDCDTTWLYGPLQELQKRAEAEHTNKQLQTDKKPILKKRTASEVILQRSQSNASLLQQAAAVIQAERDFSRPYLRKRMSRPHVARAQSDYAYRALTLDLPGQEITPMPSSSGSGTGVDSPKTSSNKRQIHFRDTVEQAIILEPEGPEEEIPAWMLDMDEDSSPDDELLMKPQKPKKRPSTKRADSKASTSSQEIKMIAPLPPADCKFHSERRRSLYDKETWLGSSISHSRRPSTPRRGSPESRNRMKLSDSQVTLRPSRPSTNFLLQGEDVVRDDHYEPETWKDPTASSATFHLRADDRAMQGYGPGQAQGLQDDEDSTAAEFFEEVTPTQTPGPSGFSTGGIGGLKRTQSGMFMPFAIEDDEDEEDREPTPRVRRGSWLGQVMDSAVDTVNTVTDIATVIWNVGWRHE